MVADGYSVVFHLLHYGKLCGVTTEGQPRESSASQEIAGVKKKDRFTFPYFVLSNFVHGGSQTSEPSYIMVFFFGVVVYCRRMRYELGMHIVGMEYTEIQLFGFTCVTLQISQNAQE
jgi:hypothetical protein